MNTTAELRMEKNRKRAAAKKLRAVQRIHNQVYRAQQILASAYQEIGTQEAALGYLMPYRTEHLIANACDNARLAFEALRLDYPDLQYLGKPEAR